MVKKLSQLAKITRPFLSEMLPRPRLFDRFSGRHQRPVTWVFGPGGSGKTSLVASYLDSANVGCIWYQVDAGDSDAASFFYHMRLAAQKTAPHFQKPLPLLTPEYRQGLRVFTRRYFEELFRRLKPPCAIVLDNYQTVAPESEFHTVISEGLACLPDGIRAIVLSRQKPPPQWIGLRAGDRMALLGWNDLRLTLEESNSLVCLKKRRKLSADALDLLHRKTDGWVAGLILLVESLTVQELDCEHLADLTSEEIFDYFAQEVLAALDPDARDFLLMTAFLPKMTVPIAESLTGHCDATGILAGLHANGFFTERHAGAQPVYQYHPLFRQFLMARAKESLTRAEIAGIQKRAANLLLESGSVEEAMRLLIDARDWPELIRLILGQAQTCFFQGRTKTLDEWLRSVPLYITKDSPWLLYWSGVCKEVVGSAESRKWFEQAFQLFCDRKDEPGMLLSWAGAVDSLVMAHDSLKPLDRWIDWLEEWTGLNPAFPSPEIEGAVAASMSSALLWRRPQNPALKDWINRALQLSRDTPNMFQFFQSRMHALTYCTWTGDQVSGGIILDEMKPMASSGSASSLTLLACKAAEANFALLGDRHEQTHQLVSEGILLADETGVHLVDFVLLGQGAYAALRKGDPELIAAYVGRMEASLQQGQRVAYGLYYNIASLQHLFAGDIPSALVCAEKSLAVSEETGIVAPEAMCRIVLAQAVYETGDYGRAAKELAEGETLIRQMGNTFFEFTCGLVRAYFAFGRGDESAALAVLAGALSLGRQKGYAYAPMLWRPPVWSLLCAKALGAAIEVEYVRDLVRRQRLYPVEPLTAIENWPWPLRIYTLGKFELYVDGNPASMMEKAQKKPLRMLKALIALGPCEISKERLIDALWPDTEGDAGTIAFHTNLHRLRRWLGDDRVVQFNEGTLSLDRRYCLVDVWIFEQLCGRVAQGTSRSPARELFDQAIALYKGVFLPADDDFLPTIRVRERLRSKFLRLIVRAGQVLESNGDYSAALSCYTKGLEADPLAEELHQGLMACYLNLGRKAEAMTAYQRCRNVLHLELGVDPSPQTELLKGRIMEK